MIESECLTLSRSLCAAFPPTTDETVAIYAREIGAAVDKPAMKRAVQRAIREKDRLPRIAQLLGLYREERRTSQAEDSVPCAPCQREDGFPVGDKRNAPMAAIAPYLPSVTDSNGKPAWEYEPMCFHHGPRHVAALWAERLHARAAAEAEHAREPGSDG